MIEKVTEERTAVVAGQAIEEVPVRDRLSRTVSVSDVLLDDRGRLFEVRETEGTIRKVGYIRVVEVRPIRGQLRERGVPTMVEATGCYNVTAAMAAEGESVRGRDEGNQGEASGWMKVFGLDERGRRSWYEVRRSEMAEQAGRQEALRIRKARLIRHYAE